MDAVSCADGSYQVPSPGDCSGCPYCGRFSIFDENLMLRHMSEEEQKVLAEFQGGFLKATAEVAMETYRQAMGHWPEETEDGEVVL
jgi:hypothetical protein